MPFLDWVNKAQATQVAAVVPYHLLEFQSAHGDGNAENLLIQGDSLYKGAHLLNDETREKSQVGHQWETSSSGRCLFLLALEKDEQGRDVAQQIAAKIASA